MIAKEIESRIATIMKTINFLKFLSSSVKFLFSQMMSDGSTASLTSISYPKKYLNFLKSSISIVSLYRHALLYPSSELKVMKTAHGLYN